MAFNALLNSSKPSGQQHQTHPGYGGLAQQFLGGSHNSQNSGAGGLIGQLAGSLLGGSKPHGELPQSNTHQSSSGMLGNLMGGHNNVKHLCLLRFQHANKEAG